jgi:prepilin-type N-terminal cleavage/methylation domain-containing protein
MSRQAQRSGFTLLEVMMAVAIMAISLGAVFSAQAGSVKMAQRARKLSFATLLVRCKMGELEEDVAKKGLPASQFAGTDTCCKDAPIEGFKCKWELVPIVLPDSMFNAEEEKKDKNKTTPGGATNPLASATGAGNTKGGIAGLLGAASSLLGGNKIDNSDPNNPLDPNDPKHLKTDPKDPNKKLDPKDLLKDPTQLLNGTGPNGNGTNGANGANGGGMDGLTAMAMQYVYPLLKPAFQSQIRRATVTVSWMEGSADKSFDVTQYIVAEQPVPLATDPNNPNALLGAGATGTGTATGAAGLTPTGAGVFGK